MTSGGGARGFGCDWASPGTLAATIEAHLRSPRRDRERSEGEAAMPSPGKPVLSARIEFCERPYASIAQERRKHSVGVEKAGNGQRDRPRRNRRQIGETAVENLLHPAFPIELHDFNRADVSKIGGRIIEGNVPVHAYPEADNVDGRGREKSRIIGRTP